MPSTDEKLSFIPPTSDETVGAADWQDLCVPAAELGHPTGLSPLAIFEQVKDEFLRKGLKPRQMVLAAQRVSGQPLDSERDARNLRGWAEEELARSHGVRPSPDNPQAVDEFIKAAEQGEQ